VIVEPFIEDVGLYATNITIENSSYPIASLSYVYKIDVATGAFTPVPTSNCTVAAGGLSFTISTASAGDYYLYGYTYVGLSSIPSLTYSYDLNVAAAVVSNSNQIRDLDYKVDNLILVEKSRANIANLTLGAISSTTSFVAFVAPCACVLNKCSIVTKDAISANDTDYWTIALTDKGSAGSDSNSIASKTTKVTGGTAFAAYDAWDIGTLDPTHRVLASGDVVLLTFTKSASATAFAEAMASIEYMVI
jgi:hypothetical protein